VELSQIKLPPLKPQCPRQCPKKQCKSYYLPRKPKIPKHLSIARRAKPKRAKGSARGTTPFKKRKN